MMANEAVAICSIAPVKKAKRGRQLRCRKGENDRTKRRLAVGW